MASAFRKQLEAARAERADVIARGEAIKAGKAPKATKAKKAAAKGET